jgi:hypothetical protein
MNLRHTASIVLFSLLLSSCLDSGPSRQASPWSSDICGRKNVFESLCKGEVIGLMLPIQLGVMILDLPLSLVEFHFGLAPFKEPLVRTSVIDFNEHRFQGSGDGEEWLVQRLEETPERFHVRRLVHAQLADEYIMVPIDGGLLKVFADHESTATRLIPPNYRIAELPPGSMSNQEAPPR